MELLKMKPSDLLPSQVIALARHRIMICRSCPTMRLTSGVGMTCGELMKEVPGVQCGCVIKIKAHLPMFGCPQKKWQ